MDSLKYIGMDVHKETISIAVLNSSGKLVMECVIETKSSTILQFIQGLRGSLHVTFEEGTWAAWLYDLLKPHVTKIVAGSVAGVWPVSCPQAQDATRIKIHSAQIRFVVALRRRVYAQGWPKACGITTEKKAPTRVNHSPGQFQRPRSDFRRSPVEESDACGS